MKDHMDDSEKFGTVAGYLEEPGAMVVLSVPSKGQVVKLSAGYLSEWMKTAKENRETDDLFTGSRDYSAALKFAEEILTAQNLMEKEDGK